MKRMLVLVLVACMLVATTYADPCPCQVGDTQKKDGPPCYANITGWNVPLTNAVWYPGIGGTGTYAYTWNWTLSFNCTQAQSGVSQCKVCSRIEMDLFRTTQWINKLYIWSPQATGSCNTLNTYSYTTTFPMPGTITFKQQWQAIWQFAVYNPQDSDTCVGQVYDDYAAQTFTVPANP